MIQGEGKQRQNESEERERWLSEDCIRKERKREEKMGGMGEEKK